MLMKYFTFCFLFFTFYFLLFGCTKTETFVTGDMLSLHNKPLRDTLLNIDTFLMGIPHPVLRYSIHNKTKKSLSILKISLHKSLSSPFIVNVNGKPSENENLTLFAGDSLSIFITIKNNVEGRITDSLVIFSHDSPLFCPIIGHALPCKIIDSMSNFADLNYTFGSLEKAYIVKTSINFPPSETIRIKEGTQFYFYYDTEMTFNGNLLCTGTSENPILFRQLRFNDSFYKKLYGQWKGITLKKQGNIIKYTKIYNAQTALNLKHENTGNEDDTITMSIISNCSNGIYNQNSRCFIANSVISYPQFSAIAAVGGKTHLLFSTLVKLKSNTSALLNISNTRTENNIETDVPVEKFTVENSIIYDEKQSLFNIKPKAGVTMNYNILYTLHNLSTTWIEKNVEHISNSKYGNPQFVAPPTNLSLQLTSPAIQLGNNLWNYLYSTDITGKIRNSTAPTAGAFE